MRFILTLAFLVLASQGQAQQSLELLEPFEVAAAVCVGPGVEVDDPWAAFREVPKKNCEKACKAVSKGCLAVVKAINKCGVKFLKAVGKGAAPICQGQGGTKAECKAVKSKIKLEIDRYLNSNSDAVIQCVVDGLECLDVCQ
jgi:hypothetical protein